MIPMNLNSPRSRKWLFGLCLFACALSLEPLDAAELRVSHCLGSCPQGSADPARMVLRSSYALAYNEQRQAADWLAYQMRAGSIGIASSLSREFLVDDEWDVSAENARVAAELEALAQAQGLERAALMPIVSVAGTPYWHEANLLSATTLRSASLERGAWSGLEWSLRNAVRRIGALYVVTGPLYVLDPGLDPGAGDIATPKGFFKLIAHEDGRLSAFKFAQSLAVHVHHCDTRTTLQEIEALSGFTFFADRADSAPALGSTGTLDQALGCR